MCGGSSPLAPFVDTVEDIGGTIGDLGNQVDQAVNDNVPGGWVTVGAAATAGAGEAVEFVTSTGAGVAGVVFWVMTSAVDNALLWQMAVMPKNNTETNGAKSMIIRIFLG
jgi:hypothetical protein